MTDATATMMQMVASQLDGMFNGPLDGPQEREIAFVLLTTRFNLAPVRANYVANADRATVIAMLRECADRLEARDIPFDEPRQ